MTVTNVVTSATLQSSSELRHKPADLTSLTAVALFPTELIGLGTLFAGMRHQKKMHQASGTLKADLLLSIVFTIAIFGLIGCGCPNTSFKTYIINITGTSLNFPALAHTTSVALSVGQQ
jgi:hypothetical protein